MKQALKEIMPFENVFFFCLYVKEVCGHVVHIDILSATDLMGLPLMLLSLLEPFLYFIYYHIIKPAARLFTSRECVESHGRGGSMKEIKDGVK